MYTAMLTTRVNVEVASHTTLRVVFVDVSCVCRGFFFAEPCTCVHGRGDDSSARHRTSHLLRCAASRFACPPAILLWQGDKHPKRFGVLGAKAMLRHSARVPLSARISFPSPVAPLHARTILHVPLPSSSMLTRSAYWVAAQRAQGAGHRPQCMCTLFQTPLACGHVGSNS